MSRIIMRTTVTQRRCTLYDGSYYALPIDWAESLVADRLAYREEDDPPAMSYAEEKKAEQTIAAIAEGDRNRAELVANRQRKQAEQHAARRRAAEVRRAEVAAKLARHEAARAHVARLEVAEREARERAESAKRTARELAASRGEAARMEAELTAEPEAESGVESVPAPQVADESQEGGE